jgi:hypothetical protein
VGTGLAEKAMNAVSMIPGVSTLALKNGRNCLVVEQSLLQDIVMPAA